MGEEDPEKLWRRCPFRASFLIDILFLHVFRCVCVYLFWKNPSHPSVSDTMATHSTSPLPSTCFHSSSLGWPYAKKIFKKREENRHDKDRKEKKIYIYITSFGVYLCCAYVYRHGWIRVGYNCYPKWRDREGGGGAPLLSYIVVLWKFLESLKGCVLYECAHVELEHSSGAILRLLFSCWSRRPPITFLHPFFFFLYIFLSPSICGLSHFFSRGECLSMYVSHTKKK